MYSLFLIQPIVCQSDQKPVPVHAKSRTFFSRMPGSTMGVGSARRRKP